MITFQRTDKINWFFQGFCFMPLHTIGYQYIGIFREVLNALRFSEFSFRHFMYTDLIPFNNSTGIRERKNVLATFSIYQRSYQCISEFANWHWNISCAMCIIWRIECQCFDMSISIDVHWCGLCKLENKLCPIFQ